MRVIARTIGLMALAGVAACGGDDKLMNLQGSQRSPDEFLILPTKPLNMPPDLAVLPAPTPGGSNITDPTPEADAVAALGGNPAALYDQGVAASDQALVAYASRTGNEPDIREKLAVSDSRWRSRHSRRVLEKLARTDVYTRAYQDLSLDSDAEQLRWQRAGARTPSATAPSDE